MINLKLNIYIHLNSNIALDDRTQTGIANAMRISKDKTGDILHEMVNNNQVVFEKVGTSKVYFVKVSG